MPMPEGTRTVANSSSRWGGLVNVLLTIGVVTLATLYHGLNQEVKSMKSSLMSETNQRMKREYTATPDSQQQLVYRCQQGKNCRWYPAGISRDELIRLSQTEQTGPEPVPSTGTPGQPISQPGVPGAEINPGPGLEKGSSGQTNIVDQPRAGTPGVPGFLGGQPGASGAPGPQPGPSIGGQPGFDGRPGGPGSPAPTALGSPVGTALYKIWGTNRCGEASNVVYSGFLAGPYTTTGNGGGSDALCLSRSPPIGRSVGFGNSLVGPLTFDSRRPDLNNRFIRCALCLSEGRTSQVMIPGLDTCPSGRGFRQEYNGFLAGATGSRSSQRTINHICVTSNTLTSGSNTLNGPIQLTDITFGSCPAGNPDCSAYTPRQKIPCVVCVR